MERRLQSANCSAWILNLLLPQADTRTTTLELNAGIRAALAVPAAQSRTLDAKTALIAGGDGPQWYRGYFGKGDAATSPIDIGRTFVSFGVSRVLVGHTIIEAVTPLYGGKVIAVQVYPHRDETTGAPALEGALSEGGPWRRRAQYSKLRTCKTSSGSAESRAYMRRLPGLALTYPIRRDADRRTARSMSCCSRLAIWRATRNHAAAVSSRSRPSTFTNTISSSSHG